MSAKQKKKRNKQYTGTDARQSAPHVVRVSAEERSRFKEWWLTYGQLAKFIGATIGIGFAILLLIIGIIGMF